MNDQPSTNQEIIETSAVPKPKRPTLITAACIFAGLGFFVIVWRGMSGYERGGRWYPFFVFTTQFIALSCVIG
jgi:hypothetical protein